MICQKKVVHFYCELVYKIKWLSKIYTGEQCSKLRYFTFACYRQRLVGIPIWIMKNNLMLWI